MVEGVCEDFSVFRPFFFWWKSNLQTGHKVVYAHKIFFQISGLHLCSLCMKEKDKEDKVVSCSTSSQPYCLPVKVRGMGVCWRLGFLNTDSPLGH